MSPENAAKVSAVLDRIDGEVSDRPETLAADLYSMEALSLEDARTELRRAENRLRDALAGQQNSGTNWRPTRDLLVRALATARLEAQMAAWRLRALEAEASAR